MCLLIIKPASRTLSRAMLERVFEKNPDGAGFAYADHGRLHVEKGFFTFARFWLAFRKIQEGHVALVHFRKQSVGVKNQVNCHPFLINDKVCVAHNGTLDDWLPKNAHKSKKSDTRYFVDGILKPLIEDVPDAYLRLLYQQMLEKTIDTGNKMAFLDSRGRYSILREWAGEWYGGCWFSNDGFKKPIELPKSFHRKYDYRSSLDVVNPKKKFKPKNQTEHILGAASQLGAMGRAHAYAAEMEKHRLDLVGFDRRDVREMLK